MITVIKKMILVGLMLLVVVNFCFASKRNVSALFLSLPIGAAPAAMGGAYTSVAEGVNSLYWNPAGLSVSKSKETTFMHNNYIEDLTQEYLGYCQYIEQIKGTLGIHLSIFDHGDFDRTLITSSTNHTSNGNFTSKDMSFGISYGMHSNEKLNFGATLKYISTKIDNAKDNAFAVDIGWRGKFKLTDTIIHYGFVVQNIGQKIQYDKEEEDLPRTARFGVSTKIQLTENISILPSLDNILLKNDDYHFALGAELNIMKQYFIRTGYDEINDAGSGLTLGLGILIQKISVDYAFTGYDDLGDSHKFSLNYTF